MTILDRDILAMTHRWPGSTDREITSQLLGEGAAAQRINAICRRLAAASQLSRYPRPDGRIGNFPFSGEYNKAVVPRVRRQVTGQFVPCPAIPNELLAKAGEMGLLWSDSPLRPKLPANILRDWDDLIEQWVSDHRLPLLIRKQGQSRAPEIKHTLSGRTILLTDNSPAQWAFQSAWNGLKPNLNEVITMFEEDRIPLSFLRLNSVGINLNKAGWKLCHIEPVGLKTRGPVSEISIERLEAIFRHFLKPSNHFLVPKQWAGFGEIPEVIQALAKSRGY